MGIVFWLVLPGLVLLVAEVLIVSLTCVEKGSLTLPVLALVVLLFTLLGCGTASGWDEIAWGIYAMMAGSGLLGSLLGLGLGWLLRRLKGRKTS